MDIVISFVLGYFISSYMSRKKIIEFEKNLSERYQEKEDMYLKLLTLYVKPSDKDVNDIEVGSASGASDLNSHAKLQSEPCI